MGVWGRGTNRVIEMCEKHGAQPPVFNERQGIIVVTFRAPLVAGGAAGTSRSESGDHVIGHVTAQATAGVTARVVALCREPKSAKAIKVELGLKRGKTFQANYLAPLMGMDIVGRTIPDEPRIRMQRYRTTEAGMAVAEDRTTDQDPGRGGDGHA